MSENEYDLCVIGGGINGAGIVRDAAGRGLKVLLLEKNDLASATSSASSKLIHGGLRYLEFYEFGLVRASLKEREVLLKMAPHIIWPMDFVLPHHKAIRPIWMIRAGLFLYDILGGRKKLKSSKALNLAKHRYGLPLKNQFSKGFRYSDCWVQDARLVVLNAMDAHSLGAEIKTYSECTNLLNNHGKWDVTYKDLQVGREHVITASAVINAAGPWVESLLDKNGFYENDKTLPRLKLIKGSHIIVPRQYEGEQCYNLQQEDGRIVFAIPYEHDYTLIGTTDEAFTGDPASVAISNTEKEYLCKAFNNFFEKQISVKDIVSTYSGVRALFDDGEAEARAVTRDYRIYHHDKFDAPLFSVFGGKITTYRQLSLKAVDKLMPLLGLDKPSWTHEDPLPGGDIEDLDTLMAEYKAQYPWLPDEMLERFKHHYGTNIDMILGNAASLEDLGEHYGEGIYEAEIEYLINNEFALTAEDILMRRTKLALHLSKTTKAKIEKAVIEKVGHDYGR